jgi:hypothetical protein
VVVMFDLLGWMVLGGAGIAALVVVLGFGVVSEADAPPLDWRRPRE